MNDTKPLIAVVGPCKAGKSTLVAGLQARGYNAKVIAQEHSYVPQMWQRLSNPDVLVYLDVSYPVALARSPMNWVEKDLEEQKRRLAHARQHAHIHIQSDDLTPEQVLARVVYVLGEA